MYFTGMTQQRITARTAILYTRESQMTPQAVMYVFGAHTVHYSPSPGASSGLVVLRLG